MSEMQIEPQSKGRRRRRLNSHRRGNIICRIVMQIFALLRLIGFVSGDVPGKSYPLVKIHFAFRRSERRPVRRNAARKSGEFQEVWQICTWHRLAVPGKSTGVYFLTQAGRLEIVLIQN